MKISIDTTREANGKPRMSIKYNENRIDTITIQAEPGYTGTTRALQRLHIHKIDPPPIKLQQGSQEAACLPRRFVPQALPPPPPHFI